MARPSDGSDADHGQDVATSDVALLEAWRGGDRSAGDRLIDRHFDAVCRFFRSKLGDDVEDLIQRTFLDCVERRDSITRPSFRAYLFAVARNRLFDHLRQGLRRPVDNLGSLSVAEMCTRPSGKIDRARSRDRIAAAMRCLPADFQIALELAYWEGLRGAEIASVLEISAHTVRSRLSRGRAMLRERLASEGLAPDDLDKLLK